MARSPTLATRRALDARGSVIVTLIVLLVAYIGYAALRGALETRRDDAEFDRDSARVAGRIVAHELYSDSGAQRKSLYKPVVAYSVDGATYQVTAQLGADLKGAMGEFREGAAIEVVYLRRRPEVARVAGFEREGWLGLAILGALLMLLPPAALAWGIRRGKLFAGRTSAGDGP